MGTIDAPNIAQDAIQIAQMPQNALQEYARTAALQQQTAASAQEMQQRQQLAPGALQQQQQVTQAQQMQIDQQKAMNQAYTDAFKPDANGNLQLDPDALQKSLVQAGHGSAIPNVMEGMTNYQKAKTDLQTKQQELQTKTQDAMGNLGYALQQANYDPQLAHTIIQDHLNDPGLTPQQRQSLTAEQQQISQNPALIKQIADQWVAQSPAQQAKVQERAKARADNATAAHQEFINNLTANSKPGDFHKQIADLIPGTDAQSIQQRQFVEGQVDASLGRGDLDSAKKFIDQQYENTLSVNKDIAVQTNPQIQAGKVAVAGATAAARQKAQTGNYGEANDPMIDMVGQNRVDLATAMQRVPPAAKEKFLTNLAAAYPEYQQQVYSTRQALMKSATSGDIGKNVTAFNTAISHAQQLSQAADALSNGDLPTLNKLGNALGYQFGSDKTTNFNVIKNALSGEISKVFKGGEATDAEIKAVQEPFSSANSPAQLKGAIDNAIHLMNSKRDALQQQYQQGMQGKPNFGGDQNRGGGGKTLPMSAIQRAAKDHGVSVDEATRQAKAAGYTIQ
jgi:hypothetical protein